MMRLIGLQKRFAPLLRKHQSEVTDLAAFERLDSAIVSINAPDWC